MEPTDEPDFEDVITSLEGLRELYRRPTKLVATKKRDALEPWTQAMLDASRFVVVATADREGRTTVSPRGGPPGFVRALDPRHLALPDYPGNNLIDSLTNIVENPAIGLMFVLSGRNETLRIDGRAWITTDRAVLDACGREGKRRPKAAIGVRITSVFFHCPSSFQRAELWDSASWRPDVAEPFDDFIRTELPEDLWPEWARVPPGS
jgi:PPOX class probable FMN-dependent enzyme